MLVLDERGLDQWGELRIDLRQQRTAVDQQNLDPEPGEKPGKFESDRAPPCTTIEAGSSRICITASLSSTVTVSIPGIAGGLTAEPVAMTKPRAW